MLWSLIHPKKTEQQKEQWGRAGGDREAGGGGGVDKSREKAGVGNIEETS